MITATWELHLVAPRSSEKRGKLLEDLALKKRIYTELRMDYLEDEDLIHVMFADTDVLGALLVTATHYNGVQSLTCKFEAADETHVKLVLDNEEGERAEISFPTKGRSE